MSCTVLEMYYNDYDCIVLCCIELLVKSVIHRCNYGCHRLRDHLWRRTSENNANKLRIELLRAKDTIILMMLIIMIVDF